MIAIREALKVGDKVFWESQSAGSKTRKEGRVFEVIPPRQIPCQRGYASYESGYPDHKIMFDSIMGRNHESYLVEVPRAMSSKAKPRLYWPRVSQLRKKED